MRYLLLVSTLFFSFCGLAQDWAPFKSSDTLVHFLSENKIKTEHGELFPLQSMALNESRLHSSVDTLIFKKGGSATELFHPDSLNGSGLSNTSYIIKGRILGDTAIVNQDSSIFKSIDSLGFLINFPHNYVLSQSWLFGQSVVYDIGAKCDSIIYGSIDSLTSDSIAVISLDVKDKQGNKDSLHPFNVSIRLSKNYGLLSTVDFTHLEKDVHRYNRYDGLTQAISMNEHFSLSSGDQFHYIFTEIKQGFYFIDHVITKIVADTLINTKRKISFEESRKRVFQFPDTTIRKSSFTLSFDPDSTFSNNQSMVLEDSMFIQWFNDAFMHCFGISDSTGFNELKRYRFRNFTLNYNDSLNYQHTSAGLAGSYWQDIIGIGEYFDSYDFGINGVGGNSERKEIVYVKKGNQSWGTPLDLTVSIDALLTQKSNINIYPNPVGDRLNIKTDISFNRISIYSLNGKLLIDQSFSKNVDVSELSKGTYLLELKKEDGVIQSLLLKQ